MTTSKGFVRAWYDWQRVTLPVSNFRQRRVSAPTYEIEHDLDHLASNVASLGGSVISGEKIEYAKLARQELIVLENIASKLELCEVSMNEKSPLLKCIDATRTLLKEISLLPSGKANRQMN